MNIFLRCIFFFTYYLLHVQNKEPRAPCIKSISQGGLAGIYRIYVDNFEPGTLYSASFITARTSRKKKEKGGIFIASHSSFSEGYGSLMRMWRRNAIFYIEERQTS